jgi:hypothetical protein
MHKIKASAALIINLLISKAASLLALLFLADLFIAANVAGGLFLLLCFILPRYFRQIGTIKGKGFFQLA